MKLLNVDVGVKRYILVDGGAPLRFNPSDPAVYARFQEAMQKIKNIASEMIAQAKEITDADQKTDSEMGEIAIRLESYGNCELTRIFEYIFPGNDFAEILCGVSLMAITEDGTRVAEKVIAAIAPILEEGAETYANAEIAAAKANRENRRANNV